MTRQDPIAAVATFALASTFFFMSGNYSGGAEIFPRAIAAIMMVCSALLFVRGIFRPTTGDRMAPDAKRRVAVAIVLTLLYVAAMAPLGFVTSSLLYIPATSYALGLRNHLVVWGATLGFIFPTHYLFHNVFHTPLPRELILRLF